MSKWSCASSSGGGSKVIPFFTYLNRAQHLMQQGLPVADLLYFLGENVPNFVRLKADDPARALPGYDYDVTNEDALLHTIHIEHGQLRGPSGMECMALALPKANRISTPVLLHIEQYLSAGGTVIGTAPQSTTGIEKPQMRVAFNALVEKSGGQCATGPSHTYGKGHVFYTTDSHASFAAMKIPPDVSGTGESESS